VCALVVWLVSACSADFAGIPVPNAAASESPESQAPTAMDSSSALPASPSAPDAPSSVANGAPGRADAGGSISAAITDAAITDSGPRDIGIDANSLDAGIDAGVDAALLELADAGATAPGRRPPATSLNFPTTKDSPKVKPWFNVFRPTDLSVTGQPLPVIVWANGGCFRSDSTWEPLYKRWAGAGFIVLTITSSDEAWELAPSTADDQGGMIDWILEQADDKQSPYAGKVDPKRIVAAGNSCGGITALALAATDPRVNSVFVLSGSSSTSGAGVRVINAIKVPVGYITGGSEDISAADVDADYALLNKELPVMVVSRATGDHITVSTDKKILPVDAEIGLNWMDLALFGTKEAADVLKSPAVCALCEPGLWKMKSRNLEKLEK
jgi:predicted dienelactone hydrolase